MKVFYLIRKIKDEWYKQEIGVYDWNKYILWREEIDNFSKVQLIGYSKFGAYLLDVKTL